MLKTLARFILFLALADVAFGEIVFPPGAGHFDVRDFGAKGDGVTDDTAAIQRAFKETQSFGKGRYATLYFPDGTYLVSDTVRWTKFLTVQGQSRERTILKLRDGATGFGDVTKPRPVLVASNWDPTDKSGSGSAIDNNLFDFTVETGRGNPGAIALDFHSNNVGALENAVLRSGDGAGVAGLECTRPWPGPALIRNVRVEGFDVGMRFKQREYCHTLEHVELNGQRVAGITTRGHSLAIRKLRSRNSVPAVVAESSSAVVVLMDAELAGGAGTNFAVVNDAVLYARDVTSSGYRGVLGNASGSAAKGDGLVEERKISSYVSHAATMLHDSPPQSLHLSIRETPTLPWPNPDEWAMVTDFKSRVRDGDWTDAIQAALDSGRTDVFFPAGENYTVTRPLEVRGAVRRLFGMKVQLQAKDKRFLREPVLRFSGTNAGVVLVERLGVGGSLNRQPLWAIEHASPTTLVYRHAGFSEYRSAAGAGPLFLENASANHLRLLHPQQVWARQFNPESHDTPEAINRGADFWCLGFKTEYASVSLLNQAGARSEILGGLIYPVTKPPPDMPMWVNEGAALSLVHNITDNGNNHRVFIRDTRRGVRRELPMSATPRPDDRRQMPLYVSNETPLHRPRLGELHFGPLAGGTVPGTGGRFIAEFLTGDATLAAIEVNLRKDSSQIIHALRFTLRRAEGTQITRLIGKDGGERAAWIGPFVVPKNVRLVGISGAGGWFVDSLRFHFSDGSESPRYGGPGGDHEFHQALPTRGEVFVGEVRGLWGTLDDGCIESMGLLTMPTE